MKMIAPEINPITVVMMLNFPKACPRFSEEYSSEKTEAVTGVAHPNPKED